MVRRPAARPAALLLAAALMLAACSTSGGPAAGPAGLDAPARGPRTAAEAGGQVPRRASGPRLPRTLPAQGLVQVAPDIWVPEADAPHWGGDGRGLRPAPGSPSGEGVLLRSAHVLLSTDLPAHEAVPLLRCAQDHVQAFMARWGEGLDLRLPREPLRIEVHARRAGLYAALAQQAVPAAAQAWYDRQQARVLVSAEPAAQGALPVEADLRHELVHAVLDQATPDEPPYRALSRGGWAWLWEGVALACEDGVGAAGGPAQRLRRARLRQRLRLEGGPALAPLCGLPADAWEGRHYDLAAAWMASLRADAGWEQREAGLLRALLRGDLQGFDAQRAFGRSLEQEQARFAAWLATEGVQ